MREIKFRAWDKKIEKYQYTTINGKTMDLDLLCDLHTYKEDFILEQHTSLKDKNGKEIYEGDIVKWQHQRYDKNPRISTVKYDNRLCGFTINGTYFSALDTALETLEVIGNIHETPELLNKEV